MENNISITGKELKDNLFVDLDTGYEYDYVNILDVNKDTEFLEFLEDIEEDSTVYIKPDLIEKLNNLVKKSSMYKIKQNWEASEIVNSLYLNHRVTEVPESIKEMIFSGELLDLPIESIVKLCEAVDNS
nr:MAG TPA: hypothetical protein [Herelleviridae sp.]